MDEIVTCSSHGTGKLYMEHAVNLINLKTADKLYFKWEKYFPCFFNNLYWPVSPALVRNWLPLQAVQKDWKSSKCLSEHKCNRKRRNIFATEERAKITLSPNFHVNEKIFALLISQPMNVHCCSEYSGSHEVLPYREPCVYRYNRT